MMVLFVFVGLFVARMRSAPLGWVIVLLSAVFLVFAYAKTAMLLLPLILLLSSLAAAFRGPGLRAVLILGPLCGLAVVTAGVVLSPALGGLVTALVPDATFTGRTDIWRFAIENIAARPLTGHGFSAFWQTDEVMYAATEADTAGWANTAVSGHNGYIDVALTTGIPGLVLAVLWTVARPLRDFQGVAGSREPSALALLFLRFWMFGLYLSFFESILFERANPVWFAMLFGLFGLRYLRTADLRS